MSTAHEHRRHVAGGGRLLAALVFTAAFALVEAVGGWLSGSLALIGDAGHMLTDSSALAIGALAVWFARRPPSHRHSYGLQRAEVIGALINALFMVAVVVAIGMAAVQRLQSPQPINALAVMVIASIGLLVNAGVAFLLSRGEQTLNIRAAMLHVLGDLLGSLGALAAGIVVYFTGWLPIDPILSLFICVLILVSSFRLLRDVVHVLLEGVPREIDYHEVGRAMARVEGVNEVHDLHIWTLSSVSYSLSAHVRVGDMADWPAVLDRLSSVLAERFGIEHVTLQAEPRAQVLPLAGSLPVASRRER
ncbi:MAG: cation diffusion facilitator family transporter [Gammaproteobacteria bacterium]